MNYLIIGAGVAGISAVKEILKRRREGDGITVITEENYPFYYRPRLIECLSGAIEVEDIIINDRDWFIENDINLKLAERAVALKPEERSVVTDKGTYDYDKLLLATGAHSFVPPIKGHENDNIFTLRHARDTEAIYRQAGVSERAVVVGSGLLGIEAGFNLSKAGLKVTLIERSDHLLSRQLDKKGGKLLQKRLEDRGLKFELNADTEEFYVRDDRLRIKLGSGKELEADLVLLSTGVRSNIGLAADTAVEVNRAISVNSRMETSVRDIYAAGDVAEWEGNFYGIWPPAMEEGKIAGKNMAGEEDHFTGFVPSYKLKVAGINVVSAGALDNERQYEREIEETEDRYRKIIRDKGTVRGVIMVGDFADEEELIGAIE